MIALSSFNYFEITITYRRVAKITEFPGALHPVFPDPLASLKHSHHNETVIIGILLPIDCKPYSDSAVFVPSRGESVQVSFSAALQRAVRTVLSQAFSRLFSSLLLPHAGSID